VAALDDASASGFDRIVVGGVADEGCGGDIWVGSADPGEDRAADVACCAERGLGYEIEAIRIAAYPRMKMLSGADIVVLVVARGKTRGVKCQVRRSSRAFMARFRSQ
jgi:hypothetical protein